MAEGADVIEVQTAEEQVSARRVPDFQLIEHVGQIACPEREIRLRKRAGDVAGWEGNRMNITGRDIADHYKPAAC